MQEIHVCRACGLVHLVEEDGCRILCDECGAVTWVIFPGGGGNLQALLYCHQYVHILRRVRRRYL